MKKVFNISHILLALLMAFAVSSCTDGYDYDSAGAPQGEQVYFSNELASKVQTSDKANSFTVELSRINTKGELNVPISVTMSEGSIYKLESNTATFKDGESTAEIKFTYDPSKVVVEQFYDITLSIAKDEYTTVYGLSSYTFKAGYSYTFAHLGIGLLTSSFMGDQGEFEWQKANEGEVYKALAPYSDDYYLLFKVADDGKTVTVDKQPVCVLSKYGVVSAEGSGILENGVITVNLKFTVSAGSFGVFKEVFKLPE